MSIWLTALLVFVCALWGAQLVLVRLMAPRLAAAERLGGLVRPVGRPAAASGGRWSEIPAFERLMSGSNLGANLERLLDSADAPIKPAEFLLIVVLSGLVLALIALGLTRQDIMAVPAAALGGAMPFLWLFVKRSRRREAFNRQLPDALQALAGALRVGLGLNQGMSMVASDHPYPISAEFARAQREMNLGLGTEAVLLNMAGRVHSDDFDLAVAGILTNRQVGGNLAELLDQVTTTLRERVKLKNFIRVLTAQQRISSIIVVAIPPILLVVLLFGMREYSSYLITTRAGHIMLAISLVMQLLGVYFIRRIAAIEV